MDKKKLVKNLIKDVQDIYSILNRFENTEQFHQLDIDLALSKVRNLYELFLKLNPQATYQPEYQKEEISTNTKQSIDKSEEKAIEEVLEKPKEAQVLIKETIEKIIPEPEFIIETPQKQEIITEAKPNNSSEIVADKFQSKKFVHDNIVDKSPKQDVSSKMQSKPIKEINTAIGLNDKFIFIRELFGGNKEHYHETIQILNNFDTYESALEFLKENFDWDFDDPNFERLTELVRRKFL
ncbi:MAG: hypothetical protein KAQ75_03200 [Bacteroidales bacterium]|nr:hypothetical protein [Bacteroidales bacterium]